MVRSETLSPMLYGRKLYNGKWRASRHIDYLDRAITDAIDGRRHEKVIVVEMPPRHGKSMFCSKIVPAWYLGNHPTRRVMLASYSARLSVAFGRDARDNLQQSAHLFGPDIRIRDDVASAAFWQLEGYGGGMMSDGVGGSFTGFGANLAIIDDPLKNSVDALSEKIRQSQIEWFQSTLWTRLEPDAVLLVIQTRWHKEDLAGWIINNAGEELGVPVRRISFPAVATTDNDELGRSVGDALWPSQWPIWELEKKRKATQGYWWDTLYQQDPGVYGNSEWPREYFGDHIWATDDEWPESFEAGVVAIDPSKGKSNKRGDYSGIPFLGFAREKVWVDISIERRPVEQIVKDALRTSYKYSASKIGLEANAFQDLLAPELSRVARELGMIVPSIATFHNSIDKDIRISRLGPLLQIGQLKIKRNAGGELLVKQMKDWPYGDHDDGPDSLEMGVRLLKEELSGQVPAEHERWNV